MSNAFTALIWWVVPLLGLLGGLGYVLWITQFKSKFESETTRSVSQFQRFQESFREGGLTQAGNEASAGGHPAIDGPNLEDPKRLES